MNEINVALNQYYLALGEVQRLFKNGGYAAFDDDRNLYWKHYVAAGIIRLFDNNEKTEETDAVCILDVCSIYKCDNVFMVFGRQDQYSEFTPHLLQVEYQI